MAELVLLDEHFKQRLRDLDAQYLHVVGWVGQSSIHLTPLPSPPSLSLCLNAPGAFKNEVPGAARIVSIRH